MQKLILLFISVFVLGNGALAQQPGHSVSTPAASSSMKPVSISYQKVQQCFAEIQDEKLSFKVDLNRLKDLSDALFVTTHSQMRMRKVHYQDAEKKLHNLILRVKNPQTKKSEMVLSLQAIDEKGVITDLALTRNQSVNPKQEVVNTFLLGSKILSEEIWSYDTKLKGMSATTKMNFKEVVEYELRDPARRRTLHCETQKDLGIICTCTKK